MSSSRSAVRIDEGICCRYSARELITLRVMQAIVGSIEDIPIRWIYVVVGESTCRIARVLIVAAVYGNFRVHDLRVGVRRAKTLLLVVDVFIGNTSVIDMLIGHD